MQNDSVQDSSVNFSADKEEIYKRVFKRSPLISSMSVGWDNLDIVYDRDPPGEISKISFQQHKGLNHHLHLTLTDAFPTVN